MELILSANRVKRIDGRIDAIADAIHIIHYPNGNGASISSMVYRITSILPSKKIEKDYTKRKENRNIVREKLEGGFLFIQFFT